MANLDKEFGRWRNYIWRNIFLQSAIRLLCLAMVIQLVAVFTAKFSGKIADLSVILWSLPVIAVLSLAYTVTRYSKERCARMLDSSLGLNERLQTALEISESKLETSLAGLQLTDTEKLLRQEITNKRLIVFNNIARPAETFTAIGLFIIGASMFFLLPSANSYSASNKNLKLPADLEMQIKHLKLISQSLEIPNLSDKIPKTEIESTIRDIISADNSINHQSLKEIQRMLEHLKNLMNSSDNLTPQEKELLESLINGFDTAGYSLAKYLKELGKIKSDGFGPVENVKSDLSNIDSKINQDPLAKSSACSRWEFNEVVNVGKKLPLGNNEQIIQHIASGGWSGKYEIVLKKFYGIK